MKIAIDVDEILANLVDSVITFHNETYNTSLTRDTFRSYQFHENWGGTQLEAIEKMHEFFQTPYFPNVQPMPGAVEAIKKLKEDHQLYVVTSRQAVITKETHEWVEKHFPKMFESIYLTNSWGLTGPKRTKKDVCQEIGAQIFIDDSLDYALECAELEIPVLMLDYPWNQAELPRCITRVFSWEEIVEEVSELGAKSI